MIYVPLMRIHVHALDIDDGTIGGRCEAELLDCQRRFADRIQIGLSANGI